MGQHRCVLRIGLNEPETSDPARAARLQAQLHNLAKRPQTTRDLRPVALDDLGLVTAMGMFVEASGERATATNRIAWEPKSLAPMPTFFKSSLLPSLFGLARASIASTWERASIRADSKTASAARSPWSSSAAFADCASATLTASRASSRR